MNNNFLACLPGDYQSKYNSVETKLDLQCIMSYKYILHVIIVSNRRRKNWFREDSSDVLCLMIKQNAKNMVGLTELNIV